MTKLDQALTLLRKAETDLRRLVADAASMGDYAAVVQIAAWARNIGDITTQDSRYKEPNSNPLPTNSAQSKAAPTKSGTHSKGKEYPRFYKRSDKLVRVSWSKSEKKEYEHRAPRIVLTELAERIRIKGTNGRVFATDELFPIRDMEGNESPSYQVYAGLALFRHVGLIDQHGRQGYSVPNPETLISDVEALWQTLPEGQA